MPNFNPNITLFSRTSNSSNIHVSSRGRSSNDTSFFLFLFFSPLTSPSTGVKVRRKSCRMRCRACRSKMFGPQTGGGFHYSRFTPAVLYKFPRERRGLGKFAPTAVEVCKDEGSLASLSLVRGWPLSPPHSETGSILCFLRLIHRLIFYLSM